MTTISGKVYPNFYAVIILLINVLIFFPLVSDMLNRGIAESWFDLLCFVPILSMFAIGSVLSCIAAFRDQRALKNHLIARVGGQTVAPER